MHRIPFAVGDSNQVANLHLPKAQGDVAAADIPADLDDASSLADAAMANHTGSEVGPGENLLQDYFHLFDVHFRYRLPLPRDAGVFPGSFKNNLNMGLKSIMQPFGKKIRPACIWGEYPNLAIVTSDAAFAWKGLSRSGVQSTPQVPPEACS